MLHMFEIGAGMTYQDPLSPASMTCRSFRRLEQTDLHNSSVVMQHRIGLPARRGKRLVRR